MAAAGKARTSPLAKNAREGFAAVRNCFIAVGVVVWSKLHNHCASRRRVGKALAFPPKVIVR